MSKVCPKCGTPREEDEFYKNKSKVDGMQLWCIPCRRAADREYYLDNREWILIREWRSSLVRRYNITYKIYFSILNKQGGVCAVCGKTELTQRQLCVDHDHSCCPGETSCGKCIRGLLCSKCNRGLGLLRDSCEILEKALSYLRRPFEQHTQS